MSDDRRIVAVLEKVVFYSRRLPIGAACDGFLLTEEEWRAMEAYGPSVQHARRCHAKDPCGYTCTLHPGHDGEHQARDTDGYTVASWPDPTAPRIGP